MKNALIIFTKNAILGKVKTRLSKDLGELETLKFYQELMKMTRNECLQVEADIHLFYSTEIIQNDLWTHPKINKHVQLNSDNLGDRMIHAFDKMFQMGYCQVVIIGTDCPYLTGATINEAFNYLSNNELVIGPAKDGGFYLLGAKSQEILNFSNIAWSTNHVLSSFLENIARKSATVKLLNIMEDIDTMDDYKRYLKFLNSVNSNNL